MREYRADFHVHTVLSACAEVEMIPPLIIEEALYKGLNLIAITDHNATGNVGAVLEAARDVDLVVLPGMELQTREEVEILCLFDTLEQALHWQAFVDPHILALPNDPEHFGPQFVVDAEGMLIREETRLLQAPTTLSLEEAARAVRAANGLAILAHIDRPAKGLMPVLGLWPSELQVDAAEVSHQMRPSQARQRYRSLPPDLPLISSSDAHWLDWIGHVITVLCLPETPSVEEIRQAFKGESGRRAYVP